MTNNKLRIKKIYIGIVSMFTLCICFMCAVFFGATPAMAYTEDVTTWTNLNFSANSTTSVYSTPSGWTKGKAKSTATSGTINLDKYSESMYLESSNSLPSKLNDNADDYVLMINAKNSQNKTASASAVQYYTNSSSLSLDAYSNYKIVVWVRVLQDAQASIYISGFENDFGFERISYSYANEWTSYTFYISTGRNTESIKTELWLGSRDNNESTNAVFFDNLQVLKISNNETPTTATADDKLVSIPTGKNDRVKYINLDKRTAPTEIVNSNFETSDLSSWSKVVSAMKPNTFRGILNLSSANESTANNIAYLGTDLTKNNNYALVLYTKNETSSYFGYSSNDIAIDLYDVVKISLNVKVNLTSGSAHITLKENDVLNASGQVVEEIQPTSETISISSQESNKFTNNYSTCSFYIKGRSLYSTSFKLELTLGSSEEEADGVVAFDNITIEYLSESDFTVASDGTYTKKINLQSTSNDFGVNNSTFNVTQKTDSKLTYPLKPTSWPHTTGDSNSVYFGVINTNSQVFNAHKSDFKISANPGNPEGFLSTDEDTNNILMMYNFRPTYQSTTSSSFSLDSNSYYKLSFSYNVLPTGAETDILFLTITDSDDNVLYLDEKIAGTSGTWKNYTIYISSNSYSNSLKIILGLGNEDNLVTGQAFFDNVMVVKQENMTSSDYALLAENNHLLDFEEGNFNLVKNENGSLLTALRYTGTLEEGTNPIYGSNVAYGGIIDAENTEDEFQIESSPENNNALKYIMVIKTFDRATYSMVAKDNISMSAGTYYKFTINVKTKLYGESDEEFGAEFGFSGLDDRISGIIVNDWTKYTIYVNCTEDVTVNLRFALKSLNTDTAGLVFFDNYTFETVEADDYNVTRLNYESDNTYLFIGDTNADTSEDENANSFNLSSLWYAIPTILLVAAILLAMVGYLMKKFKIKKWEKRKINQYDREKTVHRDVIRAEAEKRRNTEVKELKEQIKSYEEEIAKIDEVRQKQIDARRGERTKGVTLNAEREFKQFAKRRTAIENRIIMLNKQIDNMETPEYLLTVQHKIAVEKARSEREAHEKAFKAESKKKSK